MVDKVLVRTGVKRLPVEVSEYGFADNTPESSAVIVIPEINEIWVDEDEARSFLTEYADLRKLTLLYDGDGEPVGLFNPRHNSYRPITFVPEVDSWGTVTRKVDLYEFIEPQFVLVK